METLKKIYVEEIVPNMVKEFNYTTKMQVPKLEKIVLNMGVGDAVADQKFLDAAVKDLEAISGQKAVITRAKKSISGFKLREGNKIGCKVTLRGDMMYSFLFKLINIALPRVRDFRGISKNSFDGRGNYTLGVKEQLVFPEVEYDQVIKVRGLDIVMVTTAKTNAEALSLLKGFGLPFRK
jgi:large subunit ribosomal protein L5